MPPVTIHIKEWEKWAPDKPDSPLAGLSLANDSEARAIAQKLSQSDILHIAELRNGLSIRATSHIGRIALGNVQITIHPKIDRMPLMRLVCYAYGLRNLSMQSMTHYATEQDSFQELLIAQLVEEASELIARGLQRKYVRKDEELLSPRGSIQVQRIARQGGVIQATLPCTYYARVEDCHINQVLLQGLLLAARMTQNSMLHLRLQRLARPLQESVSPIRLDSHTFKKLHREMNRLTAAYKPAITLIELLLAAQGISLHEDEAVTQLPGFLFDMNLFFQSLLSRFLREHLRGYTVEDQHEIREMMMYDPMHNPRKRSAPKLRPDYMVYGRNGIVAILDAKYRDLWEKPLPDHMLYQLAIYALSQPEGIDAAILYPALQVDAQEARIFINSPASDVSPARVMLRPVNLLYLAELVSRPKTALTEREQTDFAAWLVFGDAS